MIALLKGLVISKDTHSVLLDVNGVGYELDVPLSTAFSLPETGQSVVLHTHFVVREDAQLLYGFLNKRERDMFRVLIRVNGVGPKLALAILSGLSAEELVRCVQNDEVATLVKLPGIGKKTAERLLIELRDKVKDQFAAEGDSSAIGVASSDGSGDDMLAEAEAALIALGYKPQDAAKAIKKAHAPEQNLEQLVRLALKNML
ncbi:MAG: Holliday junction branch migration protein RuvA [Oleiphilaceae bacterium]|nr:Holliday junction branch migration protein RuvA [Oleiphilaceae bacterium]